MAAAIQKQLLFISGRITQFNNSYKSIPLRYSKQQNAYQVLHLKKHYDFYIAMRHTPYQMHIFRAYRRQRRYRRLIDPTVVSSAACRYFNSGIDFCDLVVQEMGFIFFFFVFFSIIFSEPCDRSLMTEVFCLLKVWDDGSRLTQSSCCFLLSMKTKENIRKKKTSRSLFAINSWGL